MGDLVGYYYWPKEVLELLRNLKHVEIIKGNHERMLEQVLHFPEKLTEIKAKYGSGLSKALNDLSESELNMLINLPEQKEREENGVKFLLTHGSPNNPDEYVYPDCRPDHLNKIALRDYNVILMGHTHYPLQQNVKGTMLLNPGSVGQPRNKGSLASYIIFDCSKQEASIKYIRFDPQEIIGAIKKFDPDNSYLNDVLLRN